ncbi:MAG: Kae1-associated serine/threonine protein kinase [archaeon YNP-LCB-003-016]|uniref:KEOPS complex kinase/ATPase Bud32 n=1 Tax=Candidatus Culexarchaeum yellowstonense TaxID=2928963 RepID=UPI0026ED12F7|nr:KEOPS complex kinase/ATPase Bud32 [Candidatus Culexarchaeum yellowstonense]MCR6690927.1 Kae1-associated serine/threonine protein kinase [Candidatus Culexarchaeum yellowstonense]
MKLIKKGAEAELYLIDWFGYKAVKKVRISKNYRIRSLDMFLRNYRTLNEAKMLINVKRINVPVPAVFDVDLEEFSIIMEFIDGKLLKDLIPQLDDKQLDEIFTNLGCIVGRLHENGFFHGDLTTSNVILVDKNIFLIDFGLGGSSQEIESFGVDVHLMLRALESTHHEISKKCFECFKNGYSSTFDKSKEVFDKVLEIRRRGRYVVERRVKADIDSLHI